MTTTSATTTAYYGHGTPAERWERAQMFFDARDHAAAASVLAGLVEEVPEQTGPRLLLARAYYHSAQLRRAEAELRVLVERDPVEQYARLMLGRTLQRQGRQQEAQSHLRIAGALAGDFPELEIRTAMDPW
ncbi:tetratricopeptide repeat protein [Streptomyces poriticola]|uniref:tetratricopeptide repeat protein n=1 Tax=Streptomyces poriticola TaxID=3120506 RepID=UPI002FCE36F7